MIMANSRQSVTLSNRLIIFILFGIVLLGMAACGGDHKEPLPGKRIAILLDNNELTPDADLANQTVLLPKPFLNNGFPGEGGFADHANHHLALGEKLTKLWGGDIGSVSAANPIIAQPIVANKTIYTMDTSYRITAFSLENGTVLWKAELPIPDRDDDSIGGGIAYDNGRLFISTGFAQIFALNASSGKTIWQVNAGGPIRAAPAVDGTRLVAITVDNQAVGLDTSNGDVVWRHYGIAESAGLIGGATAAISGDVVIIPYSSGEIFALRLGNGNELWSENLTSLQPVNGLSSLADIRSSPVVDRGIVYGVSHAQRFIAIDMRTGIRAWERKLASTELPWVAGDYVFTLSLDNTLVSLTRRGGRVQWRTYLPQFEKPDDQKGLILWHGPILAGDRLILGNSLGELYSVSPYNGKILGQIAMGSSPIAQLPVVSDGKLIILQKNGNLTVFKSE